MANTSEIQSTALSRRTIVTRSVAGAAVAVFFSLVTEAVAKMSQKSVDYQDTPKNDQECSNCSLFQEPNSCTIVDGEISPKGWCKFWAKKPGCAQPGLGLDYLELHNGRSRTLKSLRLWGFCPFSCSIFSG